MAESLVAGEKGGSSLGLCQTCHSWRNPRAKVRVRPWEVVRRGALGSKLCGEFVASYACVTGCPSCLDCCWVGGWRGARYTGGISEASVFEEEVDGGKARLH